VSAGLKNDICGLIGAYDDQEIQPGMNKNLREDKPTADEHGYTQMTEGGIWKSREGARE
jgi:hypothetical protein